MEAPPSNKGRSRELVILIVVGVLVIASVLVFVAYGGGRTGQTSTSAGYTILPAGNVTSLPSSTSYGIEFLMSTNGTVSGRFMATGNITVYILNPTEWGNLYSYHLGAPEACPELCPPYFVLKNLNSGTVDTQLAAGRYYLVFDSELKSSAEVNVTITQSVATTALGHTCQTPDC